jgi:hypothetical protein
MWRDPQISFDHSSTASSKPRIDVLCHVDYVLVCFFLFFFSTIFLQLQDQRRKKTSDASTPPVGNDSPDLGDEELMLLLTRILFEHGKASVGKLGSLLHSYTNNHGLSAMCKGKV